MRKWNRLTVAIVGFAIGLGLLMTPVRVRAQEVTELATQAAMENVQQTEEDTAELAESNVVKLDAD